MSSSGESADEINTQIASANIRKYVVVQFSDGLLQLVPRIWISNNLKQSYFPNNDRIINDKKYNKLVLNETPVEDSWKLFDIIKIWASSDNFIRAKEKLKQAETFSGTDLNSESDFELAKQKRRSMAAYKMNDNLKKVPSSMKFPPLPRPPQFDKENVKMNSQKRKIGHESISMNKKSPVKKGKNCKSQSYKEVEESEGSPPFTLTSTLTKPKLSSQIQHNTIMAQVDNHKLNSQNFDISNPDIFDVTHLNFAVSTPVKEKKNNSASRRLFNNSPLHPKTKNPTTTASTNDEVNVKKLMQYITSTLPEINIKLNKVLLNQKYIENFLKEKHEPINDSVIDLKLCDECPVDSPHELMILENNLAKDKELLNNLKRKLKHYTCKDVAQSTKSLMDLLLTNKLGRLISLTGRGANNVADKIAFRKLHIYKLVISVIIKQSPDATIKLINKSITGWFKHAGERYQRNLKTVQHSSSEDEFGDRN